MGLVSAAQLKKYMSGIKMSTNQMESADAILDGVQADLEMYINRSIETRLVREQVTTDEHGFAYLRQSPIVYISRITAPSDVLQSNYIIGSGVNLEDLDPDVYGVDHSQDLVPSGFGRNLIIPGGLQTGFESSTIIVEYVSGGGAFLDPYVDAIILGILRVAAREFQTMHDDTMSLRPGSGEATTPVDPIPVRAKGWQDDELKRFDRIRRRVIR